jgi:C4-dicarboxylate transporter DctQ subunit
LGVLFSAILLYAAVPQVLRYRSMGMMTESNLDLQMWVLFLAMPIGAILMGIYYIGALRDALRGNDPYRVVDADPELPGEMKGPLL